MAIIERNDFGSVVVNNKVLEKLIIEELLEMQDRLVMCNKKGKLVKDKPTPFIEPDYYDSVEVVETRKSYKIVFYIITVIGESISNISDDIVLIVERVFESLNIKLPDLISINVKGVMTAEGVVVKRNIEVERSYE